MRVLLAAIAIALIASFFVIFGYYGYLHYTDKYLQVESVNCSATCTLKGEDLQELPTLKRALEIASTKSKIMVKISAEEFNKIAHLSGRCIEYKSRTYQIYLMTP